MSTSSRTPDDKMHRYLQRIEKLVGHRGKSPALIKSRNKSPISVKTPRIDNYLKCEFFFKSLITFHDKQQRKLKLHFVTQLIDLRYQQEQQGDHRNSFSRKLQPMIKKDKLKQVLLIVKPLQTCVNSQLKVALQSIKQQTAQTVKRDIKRNNIHRRTYSQMYVQSVTKSRNKSPSTIYNYEYQTPQPTKKESLKDFKLTESRLLALGLSKMFLKMKNSVFSEIRSYSVRSLSFELSNLQEQFYLTQQKLQLAIKELSSQTKKYSLQKQQSTTRKQIQLAYKKIGQLQNELDSSRKQSEIAKKQLQDSRKSFQSIQKQIEANIKQRQSTERYLLSERKQLQLQRQQFQTQKQQLESRRQQIQIKQEQIELKLIEFQSTIRQFQKAKKKFQRSKKSNNPNQSQHSSNHNQLSLTRQQLLRVQEEYSYASNQLIEAQTMIQKYKKKLFQLTEKLQQKQKQQLLIGAHKEKCLEKFQNHNRASFLLFNLFHSKTLSMKSKCFSMIAQDPSKRSFQLSKYLFLSKVIKNLILSRSKSFFKIFSDRHSNLKFEAQRSNNQRSHVSIIKIKSLHSSKNSLSNASIASSNFDAFAKKINKAFELKDSLHKVYSFAFQKIDYTALLYLSLSNPLRKVMKSTLTESFRKILFFSFSKSQQRSFHQSMENSFSFKKCQQILSILKKLDNKIVFMKIQAYSILKLNCELSKSSKIPNESIISEIQLKRQIKDFLQQRNKTYEKTFVTWQKMKQMLERTDFTSSHKVHT